MRLRMFAALALTLLAVSACVIEPLGGNRGGYYGGGTTYYGGGGGAYYGGGYGRPAWRG
jgi:hypothetical protein